MTNSSLNFLIPDTLSVIDYIVAGLLCPIVIDIYYGLFFPSHLKISNYNTYYVLGYRFLYVISAFPSLFLRLQCITFLLIEFVWIFFSSYVGKFGLMNSSFIFVAQMTGNALFLLLITKGYISISNNFDHVF